MRALLAIRPSRVDRPGHGGPVRSLPGGVGGNGESVAVKSMSEATHGTLILRERAEPTPPRRLEIWLPLVIVVLDQLTKAIVRSTVPLHSSRRGGVGSARSLRMRGPWEI